MLEWRTAEARPRAARLMADAKPVALCLMLLLTPAAVRPMAACSCSLESNPPCAALWQADAVFVGTVADRVPERLGSSLSWTVYKIAVTQVLRGSVDSFVTVVPNVRPTADQIAASESYAGPQELMSTCDYTFEVGRQYVIYARRTADGRWTTSFCAGTKPLQEAAADIDYVASLQFAAPSGRVYGSVVREIPDSKDETMLRDIPAPLIMISIASATNRVAIRTDSEGKFDVQVPAGEYHVIAPTVRVLRVKREVSVPARGCAPLYLVLQTSPESSRPRED